MKNRSNTILELSFDLWHGNLDLLFPGFSMRFSGNVALFHDAYIYIYRYMRIYIITYMINTHIHIVTGGVNHPVT
jgi:hypothetical protein